MFRKPTPRPKPDPTAPNQRSVWSFPRPPAIEREPETIRIIFAAREIARTNRAIRVLETSHPPTYYIPPEDVDQSVLHRTGQGSTCEWKGPATYHDIIDPETGREAESAAFAYDRSTKRFADYAGWLSFYCAPMDACFVGDHQATPQPGDFYSGWITPNYAGPFKGTPGSWGW